LAGQREKQLEQGIVVDINKEYKEYSKEYWTPTYFLQEYWTPTYFQ